jgi:hypothetical protein
MSGAEVAYWLFAEVTRCPLYRRCWEQSGHGQFMNTPPSANCVRGFAKMSATRQSEEVHPELARPPAA